MSLSCNCDTGGYDPDIHAFAFMYYSYSTLETAIRKRCCSCKSLIDIGAPVGVIERARQPKENSIEWRILGMPEEPCIQLANWYECEECSDIRSSLEALGYCIPVGSNLREDLDEYQQRVKYLKKINQL